MLCNLDNTGRILRVAAVCAGVLWAVLSAGGVAVAYAGQTDSDLPYQVKDGKVDRSTFLGWRVFHSTCYICHGVDATGTTVAPDLVTRVKELSAREFTNAVLVRYRITMDSAELLGDDQTAVRQKFLEMAVKKQRGELIMPAWERDPNVKPHVMDLYGYLRARADGVLGPGRPEQIR